MTGDYNSGQRSKTNVSALYFCIGFVVVLFGLAGFCFSNGSIYRILNGVDDCGNICGRENPGNTLTYCGMNDKQSEKLCQVDVTAIEQGNVTIHITHSKCVTECPEFYVEIANRCLKAAERNSTIPDEENTTDAENLTEAENSTDTQNSPDFSLKNLTSDLANSWISIVMICVVAVVFSYVLLMLFRYAIKYVIWIIYMGIVVLFALGSIGMLIAYFAASSGSNEDASGLLVGAIFMGVIALILGLVLFYFRKRIALVAQLFKEASKALVDVPVIMFEPILTFLALIFTFVFFIYFAIIIESSGPLTVHNHENGTFDKAVYESTGLNSFAHMYNFIAFLWFTAFIFGCQNFVIASAVTQWFFTRTKSKLESPVSRAFSHLLNFHLGSICLGSMLITIMKIIRMIVEGIKKKLNESENPAARIIGCICDGIMRMLEEFLQYLVRNALIIVAKDGTPLITSGKKAFRLLKKNLMDVIVLNKFGDFVLLIGKLFVVLIAGCVGLAVISKNSDIQFPAVPIIIGVIFAYLIADCFITVYEMTIDTIFISFCEDCEENNGMDRPYYMSRDLMETMQDMKHAAGGNFNFNNGNGQNIEAGERPMIPPNWQFSK